MIIRDLIEDFENKIRMNVGNVTTADVNIMVEIVESMLIPDNVPNNTLNDILDIVDCLFNVTRSVMEASEEISSTSTR